MPCLSPSVWLSVYVETSCVADVVSPDRGDNTVERFHSNHVASATPALICPKTLTFDLLTLKLVRVLPVGGKPSYQFWCFWDFSFSTYGPQHMSDAPRDIATLIFVLGGRGGCRWYLQSSCFIRIPSLKFASLTVRKIWCIFGLSISRTGDLHFYLFTSK